MQAAQYTHRILVIYEQKVHFIKSFLENGSTSLFSVSKQIQKGIDA